MSTYSTNLALELIGTGEQAGVWGTTTNTNLGTLIEQAISGYVTQAVSTGTDTTITIPNGSSGVARNMYIELTGTGGASTNLIVPANKKLYFIFNNSTGAVTVKVSGQTGVSVPTGKKMVLVSNGTDIVNGLNYIADFGSNSATITQLTATSATITNLTLTSLVISNLSIASANITTLTGSTQTLSGNLTLSGGTANGVLYLNGSKVATSGSTLTFDGTNLGIGTASPAYKLDVTGTSTTALSAAGFTNNSSANNTTKTVGVTFRLADTVGVIKDSAYITAFPDGANVLSAGVAFSTRTGDANPTEKMRLDSSGNLGIGTASPGEKLTVAATANNAGKFTSTATTTALVLDNTNANGWGSNLAIQTGGTAAGYFGTIGSLLGNTTQDLAVYANTGNGFRIYTNGNNLRATLDTSGNLGLGVTPSAWSQFVAFEMGARGNSISSYNSGGVYVGSNCFFNGTNWIYKISGVAPAQYYAAGGIHAWQTAASGTAGNTISFTEAMRLDASGRLGVGSTSPDQLITINSASTATNSLVSYKQGGTTYGYTGMGSDNRLRLDGVSVDVGVGTAASDKYVWFYTNNTERARITSGGEFIGGKTTAGVDTNGWELGPSGVVGVSRQTDIPMYVNRNGDDGILVSYRQDGNAEGSVSVSGNTVSYNAFAGSHWSQLQDGSKPDILRGTVMESINELCVWPDEQNERLPKSKVSDTAGSKKVYGVFMAWDNDWTTTNDMYITAVGAFICRVNGSVTVQEGDLLESNGDGTARVQADDIIRSSTIGKVTSTVKTHQYADGSYCVPTVLYCG